MMVAWGMADDARPHILGSWVLKNLSQLALRLEKRKFLDHQLLDFPVHEYHLDIAFFQERFDEKPVFRHIESFFAHVLQTADQLVVLVIKGHVHVAAALMAFVRAQRSAFPARDVPDHHRHGVGIGQTHFQRGVFQQLDHFGNAPGVGRIEQDEFRSGLQLHPVDQLAVIWTADRTGSLRRGVKALGYVPLSRRWRAPGRQNQ